MTPFCGMANMDSLLNKTWFVKSGFAGHTYIFYKVETGDMKAIKQIYGSGICSTASEIYDITIKGDSLILSNGLNLVFGEISKTKNLYFSGDKSELRENDERFKLLSPKPIIYNWATKEFCDQVDFSKLLNIKIRKNEIYELAKIKELRIATKKNK